MCFFNVAITLLKPVVHWNIFRKFSFSVKFSMNCFKNTDLKNCHFTCKCCRLLLCTVILMQKKKKRLNVCFHFEKNIPSFWAKKFPFRVICYCNLFQFVIIVKTENLCFGHLKSLKHLFKIKTAGMNKWGIYIALSLCIAVHPKRFTIIWGGLSSNTTSVQHPDRRKWRKLGIH